MASVWTGYISFGLISIPVRLFRAARSERVKLRELHRFPKELPLVGTPVDKNDRRAVTPAKFNATVPIRHSEAPVAEPEEILKPVRHAPISQGADRILAPSAVTKGYEYAKDEYVALATDELKSLSPKTSTEMEIAEFVHLSEIDPNYFETSYYVQRNRPARSPTHFCTGLLTTPAWSR
jgi:DNA end-binding protein Ku